MMVETIHTASPTAARPLRMMATIAWFEIAKGSENMLFRYVLKDSDCDRDAVCGVSCVLVKRGVVKR